MREPRLANLVVAAGMQELRELVATSSVHERKGESMMLTKRK